MNTTGANNTSVGTNSLDANTTGASNTALGYRALSGNTTASANTAVGKDALRVNSTGANNTAIGFGALDVNTTGSENQALGTYALATNTTGANNVAVGYNASGASTTGANNVIVGFRAGQVLTTGGGNTFIGANSGNGNVITTGSNNIAVGFNVETRSADAANSNSIVIGHNFAGASNDFSFGKAGNVVTNDFDTDNAWSRSSDERLKKNITNQTLGLDFINNLRTVKYNWKPSDELDANDPQLAHLRREDEDGSIINDMNTEATMHNFIAQEVKAALDAAGVSDFGGWKEDHYGVQQVSREMFVIPLVKAVQEQSALITALTDRIAALEG